MSKETKFLLEALDSCGINPASFNDPIAKILVGQLSNFFTSVNSDSKTRQKVADVLDFIQSNWKSDRSPVDNRPESE
jgi:hypothetical protein